MEGLNIAGNDTLSNLDGLNTLNYVSYYYVQSNSQLSSISGLENLDYS